MRQIRLVVAVLLAVVACCAQGSPLFTNGPATEDSLRCAESSGACGAAWTVFDDFVLERASVVTAVEWTAYLYGGTSDLQRVRLSVYSADPVFAGGTLLHAVDSADFTRTSSSVAPGAHLLKVDALHVALDPGTYWLGIQNGTARNFGTVACAVACGGGYSTQWGVAGGEVIYRLDGPVNYAFTIHGDQAAPAAVPEPGAALLSLAGLMALVHIRRRSTGVLRS